MSLMSWLGPHHGKYRVTMAQEAGLGVAEGDCPTAREFVGVLLTVRVTEKEKVVEEEGVTGAVPTAVRLAAEVAVLAALGWGCAVAVGVAVAEPVAVPVARPTEGVARAVGPTVKVESSWPNALLEVGTGEVPTVAVGAREGGAELEPRAEGCRERVATAEAEAVEVVEAAAVAVTVGEVQGEGLCDALPEMEGVTVAVAVPELVAYVGDGAPESEAD